MFVYNSCIKVDEERELVKSDFGDPSWFLLSEDVPDRTSRLGYTLPLSHYYVLTNG